MCALSDRCSGSAGQRSAAPRAGVCVTVCVSVCVCHCACACQFVIMHVAVCTCVFKCVHVTVRIPVCAGIPAYTCVCGVWLTAGGEHCVQIPTLGETMESSTEVPGTRHNEIPAKQP